MRLGRFGGRVCRMVQALAFDERFLKIEQYVFDCTWSNVAARECRLHLQTMQETILYFSVPTGLYFSVPRLAEKVCYILPSIM
jgi:hypothetical protein